MTGYVFDTNIISLMLRSDKSVLARYNNLLPSDIVLGCPVVWYEIQRGLIHRDASMRIIRFQTLYKEFTWDEYTREDWQLAAELWAKRTASGRPINDADLLIAVFAYHRNAVPVTDNERDFIDLNVTIENWKQS